MLEVERLDVRFGSFHAAKAVSFTVDRGASFGLVGESGSGKSTVLRAIAGLIRDWTGRIVVAGEDLGSSRSRAFRRTVQMVFQDPYGSLHPRHTVERALAEPLRIHGRSGVDERVDEALRAVGLGSSFRYRFPHQLSGGQRQRVAIARALMLEPGLLLLDEPTSSLDVSVQAEILNLLARLRAERGLTFLFVSHNLAVIAQMCDAIAIMNQGRIVETAAIESLRRSALQEPYSRQLLASSRGYDRGAVDELVIYD
ncbi:MAG: ABC transporter ATP-binding protein [Geminicoccaceae bacterium]|nr:ABC transporter ATP-binding protein [Geminicoccaceae bacterium]